jgi:cation diffusion facilitator CzcD-associated flavoprotein CzcO
MLIVVVCSNWKWPDIKGLHSFKGPLVHSANYDTSLDLKGKRVAVIGIGSSGIQIISKIASQVGQLYSWVRTPTWITAGFAQRFAGPEGANFHCELSSTLGEPG